MKKKNAVIWLIAILVVTTLTALLALCGVSIGMYDFKPWASAAKQGLDLRGGVYTVYAAKDTNVEDFSLKLQGAINVLRNRLDSSGYTEATLSKQGADKIRIEIPDVKDPDEILSIIGKPALLQFKDPDGNVIIEGANIEYARAQRADGQKPVVSFKLDAEGTTKFAEATQRLIGQKITIYLDGEEISAPTVNSTIPNGEGMIDNMGSIEYATKLASLIESGALPIELEQQEVRSISATLGADALSRSLIAGAIGVAVVMVFMIAVYRMMGVVADIALIIYMLIVYFLIAVFPGVQLTLPGIAGIILSIGMAVDANVVIYERIKEELRAGNSLRASVRAGFKKAFTAVLDANVTTVIASIVLWFFGTGSVKGFAATLFIGITVSMFTAVVVTRLLLNIMVAFRLDKPTLYTSIKGGASK